MSKPYLRTAKSSLVQNEVHLFYRISETAPDTGPQITFGSLMSEHMDGAKCGLQILPSDQHPALQARYANEKVWLKAGGTDGGPKTWPISIDLSDEIRALLSGARPELVTQWRLSPFGERLIASADLFEESTPRQDRTSKKIGLDHSKSAVERLGLEGIKTSSLVVKIDDLSVTAFATGAAFCVARISFHRTDGEHLSALEFTEAVAAVSRFNKCRWLDAKSSEVLDAPLFSLGSLVRLLSEGCADKQTPRRRITTYSFARTAENIPTDEHEALCAFLARRYTSAYNFDPEAAKMCILRDFGNIRHAVDLEGHATVIVPDSDGSLPDFLENWKDTVFQAAYSPITLLGLQESQFLKMNRSKSAEIQPDESSIETFKSIIDDALMFRLSFRFPDVSRISMHNAFSRSIRTVLGLDRKLREMESDVQATSDRLVSALKEREEAIEQVRHVKYHWLSIIGGSSLAGLTAYTMAKEVLSLFVHSGKFWVGLYSVIFGAVIIIAAVIFGYLKRPGKLHGSHAGHLSRHAMLELMIKRALK